MKLLVKSMALLLIASTAHAQSQYKLGVVSFAGTSCQVDDGDSINASIQNGRLRIPLTTTIRKPSGESIERGTCQFSMPVQLPAGYRLVLSDLSVAGDLSLAAGARSRASAEIFQAGTQNEILESIDYASQSRLNKSILLRQNGEVLVSDCGAQMILRGNASLMLQGEGRSSGALYSMRMKARLESCR